jgi:hypothetical protein
LGIDHRVDVSAAARQNVARMTSAVLFVIGNSVCAVLISHVAGNISFVDAAVAGTAKTDYFYITPGDHTYTGGAGSDFYFVGQNSGNDTIVDYGVGALGDRLGSSTSNDSPKYASPNRIEPSANDNQNKTKNLRDVA